MICPPHFPGAEHALPPETDRRASVLADEPEVTRQHLVAGGTSWEFSRMISGTCCPFISPSRADAACVWYTPGGPGHVRGSAGEEWLKAFPLQAFQHGDGGMYV